AGFGKYILLLNPDAYAMPGAIAKMAKMLDKNENIGAVAPQLIYSDGSLQNYTRRFPTVCGLAVESFVPPTTRGFFRCYIRYTCADLDLAQTQSVQQPAGAALMFRRGYIMDPRYFIYGSDLDLCMQVYESGRKILHVPEAQIVHYRSKAGTGSAANNQM